MRFQITSTVPMSSCCFISLMPAQLFGLVSFVGKEGLWRWGGGCWAGRWRWRRPRKWMEKKGEGPGSRNVGSVCEVIVSRNVSAFAPLCPPSPHTHTMTTTSGPSTPPHLNSSLPRPEGPRAGWGVVSEGRGVGDNAAERCTTTLQQIPYHLGPSVEQAATSRPGWWAAGPDGEVELRVDRLGGGCKSQFVMGHEGYVAMCGHVSALTSLPPLLAVSHGASAGMPADDPLAWKPCQMCAQLLSIWHSLLIHGFSVFNIHMIRM